MYRSFFLALSRNQSVKRLLLANPLSRRVVKHFVAGTKWEEASQVVQTLLDKGMKVTVDYLGHEVHSAEEADQVVAKYVEFLDHMKDSNFGSDVEVSVKLSALGLGLRDGETLAAANAGRIAEKAAEVGTTLTIDMEGLPTVKKAIRVVGVLRGQFPDLGCLLQANLRRTEEDCRALGGVGSRIRLSKGAYLPPSQASYADKHDVNLSFIRCMKVLMEGEGLPLLATHDPVMIDIAQELAAHNNRGLEDFEYQMLYGVRTLEQERLVDLGHTVRVYIPFGENWYSYFIQRIAERPANFFFFLRGILSR
ncbi:MAG: proline dehydrogenase family protein [Propionibacteriaceae bacterium]|nr:proline dehydrogenase family protein [Propionibacteriaceae bacterium]